MRAPEWCRFQLSIMQSSTIRSQGQWQCIDSLQTCVFMVDDGYRVQILNEAAEALIGKSLSSIAGESLGSLLVESEGYQADEGLMRAIDNCFQLKSPVRLYNLELLIPAMRKSIQADCCVSFVENQKQESLILELHTNKQLNLNSAQAESAKRKQSILKGFAHEVRNPLGGIRGAAQLLAADLENSSLSEYTEIIIREADRLSRLVERMHASASVRTPQSLNIHMILSHVHQLIQSEYADQFQIQTDYDPSLPELVGDEDQLVQAILNIARNAIQAGIEFGRQPIVTFRTRIDRMYGESQQQNRVIRVDIQDNGPGIEGRFLEQVFEPMVTTRPNGTGLGLSIAAEIVSAHDGNLTVTSEPGLTIFSLYLPLPASVNTKPQEENHLDI